jgi:hypothetical protein
MDVAAGSHYVGVRRACRRAWDSRLRLTCHDDGGRTDDRDGGESCDVPEPVRECS